MRKPCCEKEAGFLNKGAWSKQEDQKLIDYIKLHGKGCWRSLPKAAGLQRCGKSCRLRWINYLRPDIKRGNFAQDEEDLIIKLHALLGNRWSLIAGRLPGRTDNEVKNYWNSHIRKKLARLGIDPNNHKPHQHLPPLTSHTSQITNSSSSMEYASKPSNYNNDRDNNSNNNNNSPQGKIDGPGGGVGGGAGGGGISDMLASCVDHHDETSSTPLDLNLDPTIAMLPSPSQSRNMDISKECDDSSKVSRVGFEVEVQPSPTLVLFR